MFPEVHYSTQWRNLTKESRDTNLHLIIIPGLIVAHRVGGATAKVHMRLLSRRLNFPVDTPIEKLKKKNLNFWNFVSFSFGKFQEEEEEESWCARRYLWLAAEGPKKWLRVIIKVNIGRQHVHIARDQVYNHLLLFLFLYFFPPLLVSGIFWPFWIKKKVGVWEMTSYTQLICISGILLFF